MSPRRRQHLQPQDAVKCFVSVSTAEGVKDQGDKGEGQGGRQGASTFRRHRLQFPLILLYSKLFQAMTEVVAYDKNL